METDQGSDWPVGLWWKLLMASAGSLAVVIVGSGLGVEAWFFGLFLVVLAAVCAAAGAVLGLVRVVRVVRREARDGSR